MDPDESARARSPSLTRLGLHDHACLFHGPEGEPLEIASAFLRIGLARGERCFYAAEETTASRIVPWLRAAGIDVGRELASGALHIDAGDRVLPPGPLDPGKMFGPLAAQIDAALGDGYQGLRVVGQASWRVTRTPKPEKLWELEEELKRLFGERPVVAMWQYDKAGASPALLRRFLQMHPFVVVGAEVHPNCLFVPPVPTEEGRTLDALGRALPAVLSRARADHALARHVDQLHRALEGGAHALWEWDTETDQITLEPRWAEMPGIEPSRLSMTLSEWEQVVHPDELASLWRSVRDHMEGRSDRLDHECRMRDRSGAWRWVQLRARASGQAPSGKGPLIAGTATDITSLQERRDRLIASDEFAAAGRFTARVAHEINNPLAWMTTNLGYMKELLQRQGASAPSAGDVSRLLEALQETEEGAMRIREFVETLPEAFGSQERSSGPCDARGEILGAVSKARDRIIPRARMTVSVPERLPAVVAHEGELGKVFLNLLLNAAQAIPEGSPEDNEVRLTAYLRGERLIVEVTDSGVGMSPPMREHIFDLFLANETNKSTEFGPGRFLARAIVLRYGGQIEVESAPARGTTLRVLLPVSKEHAAS
jgi:signal transduction histidine kinase